MARPANESAARAMLYFARMAREARLQLLSAYENIDLAEHALGELCRAEAVDEEVVYWVGMALREALANAIKHGNKLNPKKRVYVAVRIDAERRLHLEFEDEGEGFNPAELADPTVPQNLLRSSGRGVFYMRQFMDEVRFSAGERGGTQIILVKFLNSERRKT
jgi:serine/threonine-protein kinase RsbW